MGDSHNVAVLQALEPVVARHGLVIEDILIRPGNRRGLVRVVVDLPDDALGGVDSEVLGEASRDISAALDDNDPMPGQYTLEVTTPGVSRPLTDVRHWKRARGHLVCVSVDGDPIVGRVQEADEHHVVLLVDGGGGTPGTQEIDVDYGRLGPGAIQVELNRPAGKG